MFWRWFWTDIWLCVRQTRCVYSIGAGIVLSAWWVIMATDESVWGSPYPGRFILLPLVSGALMGFGGVNWFHWGTRDIDSNSCQYCDYDLRGHEGIPERCPECGRSPKIYPLGRLISHRFALLPGLVLILWAGCCVLFVMFYGYLCSLGFE